MPPPRNKFWFRIRRKSDGKRYSVPHHDWKEGFGSRVLPRRVLRVLRLLAKTHDLSQIEVTRHEVVNHAPRGADELLKQLEEADAKGWPIW